MLANIKLLKLCEKSKEKAKNLIFQNSIFQVNRYDKEVLLNVVVCLLIVSKHHQVSQKPSQKKKEKKWLYIRKPSEKIPQEIAQLNACETSPRNNIFFFINRDF